VLGLYLRTAKYYRPSQLVNRIRLNLESFFSRRVPAVNKWRYAFPAREEPTREPTTLFGAGTAEFRHDPALLRDSASRLERGVFNLLNVERILGYPVQWKPDGATRLWCYNLHYFDYALDLGALVSWNVDTEAGATLKRLMADWIESNPVGYGIGWHSYPLARRIVNWLQAGSLASGRFDWDGSGFRRVWTQSIYQQARFLEDHLEFDISGNHLLANAKALVFAGVFWGNKVGARWSEKGLRLLWNGLQEQILEDGGHYERSPMYQSIVLQDYLEVIHLLQSNDQQIPSWVMVCLSRMADFLFSILHPDGEIPLFGDSAFGIAYKPRDILAAAEHLLNQAGRWACAAPGPFSSLVKVPSISAPATPRGNAYVTKSSLPATGYFSLFNGEQDDKLIVDGKPMGPDHLPAHGHCSLFSYELSLSGERFIVDSGVQEYEAGPWRDFWRSTRAHNTLSVDGAEQSEIWASFRVGERTRLKNCTFLQRPSSAIFVGMHSGFVGQPVPTPHRRFIIVLRHRNWVVIDEVSGAGTHTIESYVHFAPGVRCQIDGASALLRLSKCEMLIYPLFKNASEGAKMACKKGQIDPIQGWYAPEFGKAFPNPVLEILYRSTLPTHLGYLIAPADLKCDSWGFHIEEHSDSAHIEIAIHSRAGDLTECFDLEELPSVSPGARYLI
jgi:hypothetical protein